MDDPLGDFVMVVEREKTLTEAVFHENISLVKEILETDNADPNLPDSNGRTVLFWAVNRGNSELVKVLLDNGADVRVIDIYGNTALHWCGNVDILNMLFLYGADIFARNKGGLTAKKMAERRGVTQSVINEYNVIETKLLAKAGRDGTQSRTVPTVIQEFSHDIGMRNFILLLLGILFLSLYIAYTITGMSKHLEYRQPIIMDGHTIKL